MANTMGYAGRVRRRVRERVWRCSAAGHGVIRPAGVKPVCFAVAACGRGERRR